MTIRVMDFQGLYDRHAPEVRRFALYLCGDTTMADDITSETFLRALTAHERIRQPTVKSYLFTIARNVYRDFGRQAARWPEAELPEGTADGRAGAQRQIEGDEEVRKVLVALQQLDEVDRSALLMRALDEMPYEEIAVALDISVTTAKVKVHRARAKLMQARQAFQGTNSLAGERK